MLGVCHCKNCFATLFFRDVYLKATHSVMFIKSVSFDLNKRMFIHNDLLVIT